MTRVLRPGSGRTPLGVFVKTAAAQVVEVLALAPIDFGVVDAEHSPLDKGDIDALMVAGRAAGLPLLVRPPQRDAGMVQSVLDSGAAGILAPHVDDVEQARALARLCRFKGGDRGFSGSTRSAGFGSRPMAEALAEAEKTLLICQIETPEAVRNAAAIAAVEGVDGLLVGRADLAVAMNEPSASSPAVVEKALEVVRAARAAGRIAGMVTGTAEEAEAFVRAGADWFVVSSDQGLLKSAAAAMAARFATVTGGGA